MLRAALVVGLALASAVGGSLGCARSLRAPPASTSALAGAPVVWRNWATQGSAAICDAEPTFLLDELTQVNGALRRLLEAISSDDPALWTEEKIGSIEAERQRLPPVLEAHQKNLALLADCPMGRGAGFPFVRQRGAELLTRVREREAELGAVVKKARAVRALAAWHASIREQKESLRGVCRDRPRAPQPYLAWRDETGLTHWKFCDGSQVTAKGVDRMEFDPSFRSISANQRRFNEKDYLTAARNFPGSQVLQAP